MVPHYLTRRPAGQPDEHSTQHLDPARPIPASAPGPLDRLLFPDHPSTAWTVGLMLAVLVAIALLAIGPRAYVWTVDQLSPAPLVTLPPAVATGPARPTLFDCSRTRRRGDEFEIRMVERKTVFIIHCKDAKKAGAA